MLIYWFGTMREKLKKPSSSGRRLGSSGHRASLEPEADDLAHVLEHFAGDPVSG